MITSSRFETATHVFHLTGYLYQPFAGIDEKLAFSDSPYVSPAPCGGGFDGIHAPTVFQKN